MAMDRLQRSHLGEDHRAAVLGRASPNERPYAPSILCSDFGTSLASHAMASARVFFRPSGNSIGSSKRRDQAQRKLHK
jgi:hypothetical protein